MPPHKVSDKILSLVSDPKPKGRRPILWPLAFLIPWGVVAVTLNTQWAGAHLDSPLKIMQGAAAIGLVLSVGARWRKERWSLGAYLGGIFSGALLYWLTLGLPLQWQMALSMPREWERTIHPPDVLVAGRKAYDFLPAKNPAENRERFAHAYADGYFEGVVHANRSLIPSNPGTAYEHGILAGKKALREDPRVFQQVMKAFGYQEMEASGTWETGFEHSRFVADGASTGQAWWLSFLDTSRLPERPSPSSRGDLVTVRLKVHGYLSTLGRYGHMGGSGREFLVTSWTVLPTAPASARP
jgi:hypothetical protein